MAHVSERCRQRAARLVLAVSIALAAPLSACAPGDRDAAAVAQWRADGFVVDEARQRQAWALDWLTCLASPDPALRDAGAFEALSTWLRGGLLDTATRRTLMDRLLASLRAPAPDARGVRAPFEILVLSEVARTDRIEPWLDAPGRQRLVDAAATYLEGLRDWRGFEPGIGWRHGVAHGADLAMQLALNPALDKAQLDRLLAAVAAQVAPEGAPPYTQGESERLVRPVLFALQRGLHDEAAWAAWLATLAASPAEAAAEPGPGSLARRHNRRGFLFALYGTLASSGNAALEARAVAVAEALRTAP
jgi:hypothetical protein